MTMALPVASCVSPLERSREAALREQLITTDRIYRNALSAAPTIELQRTLSEVEKELEAPRRAELDRIGGPDAYDGVELQLGADLLGEGQVQTVAISLQHAVHTAAQKNLDVKFAQMQPAVRQTAVTQAQAVFDAVYFANFNFDKLDTPLPRTTAAMSAPFGTVQEDTRTFVTGIRKVMTTGGQLTVSTQMGRNERVPSFFSVDSYYDSNILVSLTQPLLRGFGEDVTRAQIMLATNAQAFDVQQLRRRLLETVNDAETAYWQLVLARHRLLIQQRLLERTIVDRDKIGERRDHDASPVDYTLANSFVESRRASVILSQNRVRASSDTLKRLINSPDLNVADEVLLRPVDAAVAISVQFNLLDAVTTALRHRPEIKQVLLNIQDTAIRQRVADNARLPQLDLSATARFNGIGDNVGEAQELVTDGEFIDYLLGLQFEMPIGNRAANALHRQRQLESRSAVIAYQNIAQQVVLETKDAMRAVIDAHRSIEARVGARLAAADNLRALDAQAKAGGALDPAFLDLRLRRLEALAAAESDEMEALTGYHIAISNLYRAMGTLLKRNGIEFSEQPMED